MGIVTELGRGSVNWNNSLRGRIHGKILMNVLMDRRVGAISRPARVLSAFLRGLCCVE